MRKQQLDTLRVGRGYTAAWTIQVRGDDGAAVLDAYSGSEPLTLVVGDLDGGAVDLSASAAEWRGVDAEGDEVTGADAAALGLVTITLDDSDTTDLAAGSRGLSVAVTDGGEPIEVYRATLRVEPRPTS